MSWTRLRGETSRAVDDSVFSPQGKQQRGWIHTSTGMCSARRRWIYLASMGFCFWDLYTYRVHLSTTS